MGDCRLSSVSSNLRMANRRGRVRPSKGPYRYITKLLSRGGVVPVQEVGITKAFDPRPGESAQLRAFSAEQSYLGYTRKSHHRGAVEHEECSRPARGWIALRKHDAGPFSLAPCAGPFTCQVPWKPGCCSDSESPAWFVFMSLLRTTQRLHGAAPYLGLAMER